MTVVFYFVRDSTAPPPATTRPMAEAAQILRRLDVIYTPQLHLTFEQVALQTVTGPGDLGSHIDLPRRHGAGAEFAAIAAATVPIRVMGWRARSQAMHARVRVHFVWALHRAGARGSDLEGAARIVGDTLLIEDRWAADVGTVVAHKAGHALGLDHPGAQRGWLMFPTTQGLGTLIPKRYVDILNPAPHR